LYLSEAANTEGGSETVKNVYRYICHKVSCLTPHTGFVQSNLLQDDKYREMLALLLTCADTGICRVSPKENAKHRDDLRLQKIKYNEDANNWKRYNREIHVIKSLYCEFRLKQTEIALLFGLSQGYVSQVISGKKRAKTIIELKK
jgi:predicted XRE-type DNA-binding protein